MKTLKKSRRWAAQGLFSLFAWEPIAHASVDEDADREAIEEDRATAMEETQFDLETAVEEFGGLEAIRSALAPARDHILATMTTKRIPGDRVSRVGAHRFNVNITPPAIAHAWDSEYGEGDPVGVVIDFHHKLQSLGIDLIVVPIPSKIEAYYGEFGTDLPFGFLVSPGRVEAIYELIENGVEVVDVLPTVFDAMSRQDLQLYETSGHHLSGLGAKLAGELIAQRLERYSLDRKAGSFSERRRTGTERIDRSVPMKVWQVLFEGKPYEHPDESEVIVIGDSNAFAFGTASMACHIAKGSGVPLTDISTSSGASTAHIRLARGGLKRLRERKVVIWVITSTHFERFAWQKTELFEEPTLQGLFDAGDIEGALRTYETLTESERLEQRMREDDLNEMGYDLLRAGDLEKAIGIFSLATKEYAYSANLHDSLGEALIRANRPAEAVNALKRALELNPSSSTRENSLKLLTEIGHEYVPKKKTPLPLETLQSLVGSFELTPQASGVVTLDGRTVTYTHVGQTPLTLAWVEELIFNSEAGFVVTFEQDGADLLFTLEGIGRRWTGKRVSKTNKG